MKRFTIGVLAGILLTTPLALLAAPTLAEKLQGKILLAVEDAGKTYYVHEDGMRYRVTRYTAQRIFEELALGITDENLAQIPLGTVAIEPEPEAETHNNNEMTEQLIPDEPAVEPVYEDDFAFINQAACEYAWQDIGNIVTAGYDPLDTTVHQSEAQQERRAERRHIAHDAGIEIMKRVAVELAQMENNTPALEAIDQQIDALANDLSELDYDNEVERIKDQGNYDELYSEMSERRVLLDSLYDALIDIKEAVDNDRSLDSKTRAFLSDNGIKVAL